MTNQEALETIELICGDDFCEDMCMRYLTPDPADFSPQLRHYRDLRIAIDKLSAIYRIAHSFAESHSCFKVHDDWREEAARKHAALYSSI